MSCRFGDCEWHLGDDAVVHHTEMFDEQRLFHMLNSGEVNDKYRGYLKASRAGRIKVKYLSKSGMRPYEPMGLSITTMPDDMMHAVCGRYYRKITIEDFSRSICNQLVGRICSVEEMKFNGNETDMMAKGKATLLAGVIGLRCVKCLWAYMKKHDYASYLKYDSRLVHQVFIDGDVVESYKPSASMFNMLHDYQKGRVMSIVTKCFDGCLPCPDGVLLPRPLEAAGVAMDLTRQPRAADVTDVAEAELRRCEAKVLSETGYVIKMELDEMKHEYEFPDDMPVYHPDQPHFDDVMQYAGKTVWLEEINAWCRDTIVRLNNYGRPIYLIRYQDERDDIEYYRWVVSKRSAIEENLNFRCDVVDSRGRVLYRWLSHHCERSWLRDIKRLKSICFTPYLASKGKPRISRHKLNMWEGYRCEGFMSSGPSDMNGPGFEGTAIHEYMLKVLCAGSQALMDDLLNWLANLVQFPRKSPELARVFYDDSEDDEVYQYLVELMNKLLGPANVADVGNATGYADHKDGAFKIMKLLNNCSETNVERLYDQIGSNVETNVPATVDGRDVRSYARFMLVSCDERLLVERKRLVIHRCNVGAVARCRNTEDEVVSMFRHLAERRHDFKKLGVFERTDNVIASVREFAEHMRNDGAEGLVMMAVVHEKYREWCRAGDRPMFKSAELEAEFRKMGIKMVKPRKGVHSRLRCYRF